ncbi:MAG: membrane protein insertase YidC [Lachnospiraceae bacterium]|nr:membrane protein insertase YidC [Lachnospiraceae bacterium]
MNFLYEGIRRLIDLAYMLCGDYGIAIVLITLGIRLCLVPLGQKQRQAMKRQQELGLKAEEIRETYKHNTAKRDKELEQLYQREGMGGMGAGCLLTLLQLPIMLALYQGIRLAVTAEMTTLLLPWVPSLLARDPSFILPILTVLVQTFPQFLPYLGFFQCLKLQKPQISTILIMILMNSWFAFLLPAGVELYYLISGLFTSVEQTVGYAREARRLQTV